MVWGRNYFGELVMSTIRRLRLKMLEDNAESHVHHRGCDTYKWGSCAAPALSGPCGAR